MPNSSLGFTQMWFTGNYFFAGSVSSGTGSDALP